MSRPWGTLPVSRIHTIMKSSSDAEQISKESAHIMSKLAEFFIKVLSEEGYRLTNKGRKLDYKHVAAVVHNDERYEFLRDMIPRKITVSEYKRILARKQQSEGDAGGKSEDDEDDSDDSSNETSTD